MARNPRDHRLETREKRLKLAPAKEPYWRQLVPGTFLGYYRGARGSAWIVRQRSGTGYAAQRLGIPDDNARADGDVVLSYAQAVKRASEVQLEKRSPAPKHYADGVTLNTVVDSYLEGRQSAPGGRSGRVMPASTAKVSALSWGRYGRDSIGQQLVTALDAKALRNWHAGIASQATRNRGKVQPFDPKDPEQVRARRATANRVLTIAKAALRYARNGGALPDTLPDYWQRVLPFALGDDPPPRMLEDDEAMRLLNAAEPDLRELLTAALMTGGRYSELRALRAADYAADEGLVRLFQSKTGKTLWQPLTPEGRKFFDRVTSGKPGSALLFARADGSAWAQSDATRPMRDAVAGAKLEDVSFKATRATYGKRLLLATRDLELVAKALGHSDSRITRKHYAQYLPSELATAMNKIKPLGIAGESKVSRIGKSGGQGDFTTLPAFHHRSTRRTIMAKQIVAARKNLELDKESIELFRSVVHMGLYAMGQIEQVRNFWDLRKRRGEIAPQGAVPIDPAPDSTAITQFAEVLTMLEARHVSAG